MPIKLNFLICWRCGRTFARGDSIEIEFSCPKCKIKDDLEIEAYKLSDPKNYKTTWCAC